jgi:hypothetical protein
MLHTSGSDGLLAGTRHSAVVGPDGVACMEAFRV